MVIAEDEMEDSPKHHPKRPKKFPSMDQQDFHLLARHPHRLPPQPEPQTSRDYFRAGSGSPLKYSSILQEEGRR
jgi:hypothetical protein